MKFRYDGHQKMNTEVAKYLLQQRETVPDARTFSVGGPGWHSHRNLTGLDYDWSQELKDMILRLIKEYGAHKHLNLLNYDLQCWAIILDEGGYSNIHTHPGSFMSGVYYVRVPEEVSENAKERNVGSLSFPDMRAGAMGTMHESPTLRIPPKEGQGVVFPSWVPHYVTPYYHSDEVRISISWNIKNQ
jgi:uncharacterized protein (TIGR02466 family)